MAADAQILERAKEWLSEKFDKETQNQVKDLIDNNEKELVESFYKNLEFGTGGMRGIMGVGTNRMNVYTVGMATQGLANYLNKTFAGQEIKVAVSFDSRNNSRLFAKTCADIFSANGIKAYIFDALRPVPELSFAVRELGCKSGVMITASHNPKEYNGYKAYWSDGAQVVAPHDKNIVEEASKVKISDVKFQGNPDLIETLGEDFDKIYLEKIKGLTLSQDSINKFKDIKIVYTPIHGSGVRLVPEILKMKGFENILTVKEQCNPDGNFPTVVSPNPENAEALTLEIPAYRVDVTRPCDVVEDILRIYGYNNVEIPTQLKGSLVIKGDEDRKHKLANLVSEQLVGEGFNEILNNSLTKAAYYEGRNAYPVENCVKIMNPLSTDLNVMRQTLLFGGLESIQHNVNRKRGNLRFFEFGNVYTFDPAKQNDDDPMQAYKEQYHAALWLTGKRVEGSWAHANEDTSIYELRGCCINILRRIGVKSNAIVLKKSENDIFSTGMIIENRGGKKLYEMGVISKKLQKQFGLDNRVYYAEFNWTALMKMAKKNEVLYTEVPKFPAVSRDLALLLDNNVEFAQIEQIAYQTEKKLLKRVELFDVYEGDKLPAGKKSYAVNFILQDEEKTMGDKQIDAIMQKLIANIKKQLNAELR